jgi:hypothetical protein
VWGGQKARDHYEDKDIGQFITLRWILARLDGAKLTGFMQYRIEKSGKFL